MTEKYRTTPNPGQPGRCPSIDPHGVLQCTRSIHDDDQCRAGGIAWRKGVPPIRSRRELDDECRALAVDLAAMDASGAIDLSIWPVARVFVERWTNSGARR